MIGTQLVDWHALWQVIYISAIAGILIALSLGVAVVSSLRASDERAKGETGAATLFNAVTVVCTALVALAVGIGIYYIAHKS
jgi:UPF0716 family protein affecting phage T7 exclusion